MHFTANVRSGTEVCDYSQILGIKICDSRYAILQE